MHHDLFGHVQTWRLGAEGILNSVGGPKNAAFICVFILPEVCMIVTYNPISYLLAFFFMYPCKAFIVYFQRKTKGGINHRDLHWKFGESA